MHGRTSVVALLALAAPSLAQVTASQAPTPTPAPSTEICPLQLDIDLSQAALGARRSLAEMPEGGAVTLNTSRYVCDKARVQNITVRKEKERPREVLLDVSALLSSQWMRQDVNLTVSLLVNGKVVKSSEFRALTIGDPNANWASRNVSFAGSSSKTRGLHFWVKRATFDEWFGAASKPSVRVVLQVVAGDDEQQEE